MKKRPRWCRIITRHRFMLRLRHPQQNCSGSQCSLRFSLGLRQIWRTPSKTQTTAKTTVALVNLETSEFIKTPWRFLGISHGPRGCCETFRRYSFLAAWVCDATGATLYMIFFCRDCREPSVNQSSGDCFAPQKIVLVPWNYIAMSFAVLVIVGNMDGNIEIGSVLIMLRHYILAYIAKFLLDAIGLQVYSVMSMMLYI